MDQHNGTLSDSLSRLTRESAPLKRKFAPNLSKALAKKTVADSPKSGPKPKKLKDEAGDDDRSACLHYPLPSQSVWNEVFPVRRVGLQTPQRGVQSVLVSTDLAFLAV
nr:unnamed protein product [Spirometra erinaceieuropaei]